MILLQLIHLRELNELKDLFIIIQLSISHITEWHQILPMDCHIIQHNLHLHHIHHRRHHHHLRYVIHWYSTNFITY